MSVKIDVREKGGSHNAIADQLRAIANWITEARDTTIDVRVEVSFVPKEAKP